MWKIVALLMTDFSRLFRPRCGDSDNDIDDEDVDVGNKDDDVDVGIDEDDVSVDIDDDDVNVDIEDKNNIDVGTCNGIGIGTCRWVWNRYWALDDGVVIGIKLSMLGLSLSMLFPTCPFSGFVVIFICPGD